MLELRLIRRNNDGSESEIVIKIDNNMIRGGASVENVTSMIFDAERAINSRFDFKLRAHFSYTPSGKRHTPRFEMRTDKRDMLRQYCVICGQTRYRVRIGGTFKPWNRSSGCPGQ